MKMSDMFALPVRRHFSVVVDRNEHQCSYSEQINFAVHAINNHDRLEQENAELREALRYLIKASEENEKQLNELLMCNDYGESEALCKARQLLNK